MLVLKIGNAPHKQKLPTLEHIVPKHNASVTTGSTSIIMALNYVENAMIIVGFREVSTDKFKNTYFAPLDKVFKKTYNTPTSPNISITLSYCNKNKKV